MFFKKMKYQVLMLTFIFSVFSNCIYGQHQVNKKALRFQELSVIHFRQGDTINAFDFALEAIKKDSLYATPWVMLGNIYEEQKQHKRAIQSYSRALDLDPDEFPDLFYVLGELELEQKDFDNAKIHVKNYLSLDRAKGQKKEIALKLLERIDFRELAYAHPVDFSPINLGDVVNSVHDDYVNSLSTDENSMYLTIKKNLGVDTQNRIRYSENIYQANFYDSSWSAPQLLTFDGEFGYATGGASVSPNNRYLFFTSCNQSRGQGSCDLNYAMIKNGKLTNPNNLGPIVNSSSWDSQPSFSTDGKNLFFASKRPGGYGGSDIWISELDEDGRFQKPYNAGAAINTSADEMAPLIHYDAKTLYFSSNGHLGMGGFDLFMTRKENEGRWTKPKNLGYPLNTGKDEINLIVAPGGKTAFISSDQGGGYGGFDIYQFELANEFRPAAVTYVEGVVFDAESGEKLNAKVELTLLSSGEQFTRTESDKEEGVFLVALPMNQMLGMNVSKQSYLFHSEHYHTLESATKAQPVKVQIPLKKIKPGARIVLNNIFFETDKFELKETSFPELDKLFKLMNDNPELRVEISGHTDAIGGEDYNLMLSERRAKSVFDYLVRKGIVTERMIYVGFGFTMPLDTNETDTGRSQNRRTEIRILDVSDK